MNSFHDNTTPETPIIPDYETVADLEKFFFQSTNVDEGADILSSLLDQEGEVVHIGVGTVKELMTWVGGFIATSTILISIPIVTAVNIIDLISKTR